MDTKMVLYLSTRKLRDLENFLNESDIKVITLEEFSDGNNIIAIITDSITDELRSTISSIKMDDKPIISLDPVSNIESFINESGRAILNPQEILRSLDKQIWLKTLLGNESSIHLDESSLENFEEVNSFHLTNHFSSGVYLDSLAAYAAEYNYDFIKARSFCHFITSYYHLLRQNRFLSYPIDMEYGNANNCIMIRFSSKASNYAVDLLSQSFKTHEMSFDTSDTLLFAALKSVDHLEISYHEKSKVLTMTGKSERYNPLRQIQPSLGINFIGKKISNAKISSGTVEAFNLYDMSKKEELNNRETSLHEE